MTTISTRQFDRARQLALRLAGIELFERHRRILCQRIERLGMRDERSVEALLDAADLGDESASRRFVALLTTNFTGFFRHPHQFTAAAAHALDSARDHEPVRMWSAACSTGEEPFSLAIAAVDAFGGSGAPVSILATDIDVDALESARLAEFGERAMAAVDGSCRNRRFQPVGDGSRWRIADEIRRLVEFRQVNLIDDNWPVGGEFDVIFCRNVLMYLEPTRREAVTRQLISRLEPGGLLIIDPAEHLGQLGAQLCRRGSGVHAMPALPRIPVQFPGSVLAPRVS